MSVIKDYSSLSVSIVIAVVAMVLVVVTGLMSNKLTEKIEQQSISRGGKQINTLLRDAVPNGQAEVEQDYQKEHAKDANQISGFAVRSSQRPLLSYSMFPEPTDKSSLIFEDFGKRFRTSIDKQVTRVNGRDCPTEIEVNKHLKLAGSGKSFGGSRRRGANLNLGEVESSIVDALCTQKAQSASVYVNPEDLSGYGLWGEYEFVNRETAVVDCWYWQLGYWVIEDVIDTVKTMNVGSSSVLTSGVKRILSVNFTGESQKNLTRGSRRMSRRRQDKAGKPAYVLSVYDGLVDFFTGRFCNDEYDVIHFNVVVLVRAKDVPVFMRELCGGREHVFKGFSGDEPEQTFKHNQITILETKITSIESDDSEHQMYRYGDDAIVKLDMICEYLFNKAGYEAIMPEEVKKTLKPDEKKW